MESLKVTKFKAFNDELSIHLDNKNLLLYGENGAGKSSLYEAIKIIFYHQKLESSIISSTPEDQNQKRADFWSKYNNQIYNQDFEIKINDVEYLNFDISNYQAYMISLEELKVDNVIRLSNLVEKFNFSVENIDELLTVEFAHLLEDYVNNKLDLFNESVNISIEVQDNFAFIITDTSKNISSKNEIRKFFNEAKINTILLLVLLAVVKYSTKSGRKKILVLDDVITSLDASNRSFLIKHVLEGFHDMQVLIFTHNISFYNLVLYMIKNIVSQPDGWLCGNLYEISNSHKVYFKTLVENVENINNTFIGLASPHSQEDIDSIGNRIRKKFEILLYEFSKLSMIGTVEDSNKIINRILNGKPIYYNSKETASDLVDKLQMVLNQNISHNLSGRLQSKIDDFTKYDFLNFRQIVKELKLYQKITMHPLSHGVASGMPTFTVREIKMSLDLLQKMEEHILNMSDNNVSTI